LLKKQGVSSQHNSIQRYAKVAATGYTPNPGGGLQDGAMFDTQAPDPTVNTDHEIRYPTASSGNPPLLVSDDGTLALNDTADEAKEFYSTPQVVTNANTDLERVGSPVRLDNTSSANNLTVGTKTLNKVRPKKADKAGPLLATEVADFVFHRCIYVAHKLMGSGSPTGYSSEVVFDNQDDPTASEQKLPSTESDTSMPVSTRIANYMTTMGTDGSNEGLEMAVKGGGHDTPVGEAYGRASGTGALDTQAEALGVNQFAHPKVGEGYATASVTAGPGHDREDFSQMQPLDKPRQIAPGGLTWSYHFAAVAAASIDGADHVTLENYNRGIETKEKLDEIVDDLDTTESVLIASLNIPPKTKQAERAKLILAAIYERAGALKVAAEARAKAAVELPVGTMWYFKMFGSQAGQSFHEAQVASGFFVNPLTMRVRPPTKTQPIKVFFGKSSSTLLTTDNARLIMPGVINGIISDLTKHPDRTVEVTGYANTKMFGSNTTLAGQRADTVKQILITQGVPGARIVVVNGGEGVVMPKENGKSQTESNRQAVIKIV
jgi:outer membrane protein OmpA-like peptidoglycan-associated protein